MRKVRAHRLREPPFSRETAIAPQLQPERRIADRSGHEHMIAGRRSRAPRHLSVRDDAERRNRNGRRPGSAIGIAAEQRTAILGRVLAEPACEAGKPGFVPPIRQGERQQEAERLRAFGGEVGEIYPQRLAADRVGRIVGKEMDAADDAVGREHEIASRRRRYRRRVIAEAERAGMGRQRAEIARDQAIFGRFPSVACIWHCIAHRSPIV